MKLKIRPNLILIPTLFLAVFVLAGCSKNDIQKDSQTEDNSSEQEVAGIETENTQTIETPQNTQQTTEENTVVENKEETQNKSDSKSSKKKTNNKKDDKKSEDNNSSDNSDSSQNNQEDADVQEVIDDSSPNAYFTATGFRNTKIYTYTTQVFKGDTVSFDASNSGGDIISYDWDFGDGKVGTGKKVTNTYNTNSFSNFNVILTVTSSNGKKDKTNGYFIHYIGEPRLLISLDTTPEAEANKYACGKTIKASANTYSPYGDIEELDWELMRGAISHSDDSDKILKTKTTDKDGTIDYSFDCETVAEDAVLQERNGEAVYSFVVRKMTDSKGNELIFDKNKGDGSKAITIFIP